jgi:hypothetical protein
MVDLQMNGSWFLKDIIAKLQHFLPMSFTLIDGFIQFKVKKIYFDKWPLIKMEY